MRNPRNPRLPKGHHTLPRHSFTKATPLNARFCPSARSFAGMDAETDDEERDGRWGQAVRERYACGSKKSFIFGSLWFMRSRAVQKLQQAHRSRG